MMNGLLNGKVGWALFVIFEQRMRFIPEISTAVFNLVRKTGSRYCHFISEMWDAKN